MINIMDILGVTYKEDIISNLLIHSLNNSVSFKTTSLENLVQLKNVSSYTVKAYTRIGTSMGIPDIVIALKWDEINCDKLIIIENKLKATEGYEQTKRYTNEKCISELYEKVELNYKDIEPYFIYLTLIPEQIPSGEKFQNIDYKYLINNIKYDNVENTFDIHVETSYDVINKNMNLYLHYEINPYISVREAKQRSTNNGYYKYLIQRNIIKTKIHNNIKKYNDFDIKSRNGSNQIAKIQLKISSNTTVKELIDNVSFYVVVVSDFINVILK